MRLDVDMCYDYHYHYVLGVDMGLNLIPIITYEISC